jgi:hypothetical protein
LDVFFVDCYFRQKETMGTPAGRRHQEMTQGYCIAEKRVRVSRWYVKDRIEWKDDDEGTVVDENDTIEVITLSPVDLRASRWVFPLDYQVLDKPPVLDEPLMDRILANFRAHALDPFK